MVELEKLTSGARVRGLTSDGTATIQNLKWYGTNSVEAIYEDATGNFGKSAWCPATTWPMRTEMETRMIGRGTNALASSIVLTCRVKTGDSETTIRGDFRRALRQELPDALRQAGNVRLKKRSELPEDWDPARDRHLTVWEATQHLIKRLEGNGEQASADLVRALGPTTEKARDLAYRLYSVCERKKWADEARAYNGLVIAWPELEKLTQASGPRDAAQGRLL